MRKLLLLAALGLSAMSAPAWAQNTKTNNSLTGPYVGGNIGYTIGSADTSIGGISNDTGLDGFQGGLLAGYGFQFDPGFMSSVWSGYTGLEFGYDWSDVDGDAFGVGVEKKDSWSVTLRPGVTYGNTALGYGIIGYSRTKFEAGPDDEHLDGLVLGAGTEFGDMGPLKARVEYVYTNYEDTDIGGANFDAHDNTIKLGGVLHF